MRCISAVEGSERSDWLTGAPEGSPLLDSEGHRILVVRNSSLKDQEEGVLRPADRNGPFWNSPNACRNEHSESCQISEAGSREQVWARPGKVEAKQHERYVLTRSKKLPTHFGESAA